MTNTTSSRKRTGAVAHPRITWTAAMLAMLAGAPMGLAQEDGDNPAAGFASLMNMFSGQEGEEGQDGQAQPGQPEAGEAEWRTDGLYYDANMTVELHVQDEELVNVLQMLSIQSERNIVASKDVSARVTANLYGVTFHEALDAILHVNGYGYIERGNFIYVYPLEEIIAIEQASREREVRVLRLNFLNAVDAGDFVSPLLSTEGEIKANGKASTWTDPTTPSGAEDFANESTLVVYDYAENIEAIERLVAQIDTRPAQILVEATIVQTSLNESNAFGVDFSIIADLDMDEFLGGPLSVFDGLQSGGSSSSPIPSDDGGTGIVSTPGNTGGAGTFKAGVVSNDVAVFLRALDEVADTTIISNPKVVTLNRQAGRVLVGRKVGYLSTTATETSTTQTVEFLDTGTQLNFRPFVTSDGLIRLELKPQVSEAQLRSATDATGAAVTIPDEVTNELIANVLVPDGHTVVLGGLFRESTAATRRQIPLLGDIPILGTAFRGQEDEVNRQEIIFMITPSIVSDQVLVDAGLRGEEMARRVRAGAREGLLPFSRERQAAQLLVEAEHLAADGETDRALHKLRRTLNLHPNQTGAIELRERLLNEKDIWPSRSLLEAIVKTDAEETLRHNILDHGWWGVKDLEPTPEDPADEFAQAEPEPIAWTEPQAVEAETFEAPAPMANTVNRRGGRLMSNVPAWERTPAEPEAPARAFTTVNGDWWNSEDFQVFMTAYGFFAAEEQGIELPELTAASWWSHPRFVAFVSAFSQAASQERGDAPHGPLDEWWSTPEFEAFASSYDAAHENERIARENGTDASGGSFTEVETNNDD